MTVEQMVGHDSNRRNTNGRLGCMNVSKTPFIEIF